ncbi:M23 family metallopeptidase [Salinibacter ruber]|uniref:M23 family metallopeptidase n=1 Tax=Salinibacter ruber TaxID=146919 RepID=UPI0021691099|nr:M23 family metallopeptidase [Salinibacter ruber]
MSSDATRAQEARPYGRHASSDRENRSISSGVLAGGVFLLIVLAAALLGTALLGHADQASTDLPTKRISNEEWGGSKETPRPGSSTTEGIFEARLPEQAQPEAGALGYLQLLEHLPAQPPAIGAVSSPFGPRIAPHRGFSYAARYHQAGSRFGREEFHSGIDIAVPPGTPVRAPGPGVVIATGRSPRLGTYVRLLHDEVQLETVLAHLSRTQKRLRRGQLVRRGEVVGFSGNSGRSTGPHLHFEIRSLPGRVPIDPTEVYELYFTCLDHLSRFPIGSVHARLEPYRIWTPVGVGGGKSE